MSDEDIKLTEKFSLDERRTALRRFRKENKLSAAKLGEMAGLAESTITRFERGGLDLSEGAMRRVTEAIIKVSANRRLKAEEEEVRIAEIEQKLVQLTEIGTEKLRALAELGGAKIKPTPRNIDENLATIRRRLEEGPEFIRELLTHYEKLVANHEEIFRLSQERISHLETELSRLRSQLAEDIAKLRLELEQKSTLAAEQGGDILSENGVADSVIAEEPTKARTGE